MIKFIMLLLVVSCATAEEEKKVCTEEENVVLGVDAEGKPVVVPLGVACATWGLPKKEK